MQVRCERGMKHQHMIHDDGASAIAVVCDYTFRFRTFESFCVQVSLAAGCCFLTRLWICAMLFCVMLCGDKKSIGWWVKVGQFLSTRSDLLPQQYIHHLIKLQDMMPTTPYAVIEKTLQTELGKALTELSASSLAAELPQPRHLWLADTTLQGRALGLDATEGRTKGQIYVNSCFMVIGAAANVQAI